MSVSVLPTAASAAGAALRRVGRVAVVGPPGWLDSCAPPVDGGRVRATSVLESTDPAGVLDELRRFSPRVTVVFDPLCLPADCLARLPGTTLGIAVGPDAAALAERAQLLDRIASFRPGLTGCAVGTTVMWRAFPPPVSDALYGPVRPLHGRPLVMAIGRSTEHREHLLLPAKHHHDVLHLVHGVGGEALIELLREYDVGIYAPPQDTGGVGPQPGIHLAAGQLLFATGLAAAHGLEAGIDYLSYESPEGLVWALDRLVRFPEMHQRLRMRGRMKAESYRASRLLGRIVHDLLVDVAVFGTTRRPA